MSSTVPVLEVRDLAVGYAGAPVVRDVGLSVSEGEIVALIGLNGAGKTTTLRCIAGALAPIAGMVLWRGQPMKGAMHKRVRNGIAYVAEDRSVLMSLTVAQNMRLGRGPADLAFDLFPELRAMASRRAGSLSGGEQQMLTLARAIAAQPSLLLIDELSLGLAPTIVKRLLRALTIAAGTGIGVLLVEQQVRTALSIAHRGYVLERGRIVDQGSATDLTERLGDGGILGQDRAARGAS